MKSGKTEATVRVCVGFRRHRNRKDKQVKQKLLFAAWRVGGTPVEIRERYRQRFGIEASFRQLRQARIPGRTDLRGLNWEAGVMHTVLESLDIGELKGVRSGGMGRLLKCGPNCWTSM
ncbi:MAG: hypothetical protein K8T91_22945 [Planctomycetes bacterium]|nr:hypothetical protein [Planctomycetota bacterium]